MPQLFHRHEPTGLLPPNWPHIIPFIKHSSLTLTKFSFTHSNVKPWTRSNFLNLIAPFQSAFPHIGKKPCKIVKQSRKSHSLPKFVASKASVKLPVQPCCTPLPCKLPGHQLINYARVLDTAHLPPLKQNNGNTDFLLSIHLQAGCSTPSPFPWELRIVWIKESVFKTYRCRTTPQP